MKLGLKLLQERAKTGSFWWPYISNLPETYSVPIFFPGEDIKNLQYAPLLYQVGNYFHGPPHNFLLNGLTYKSVRSYELGICSIDRK